MEIGRLKKLREAKGLSQAQLGLELGFSAQRYNYYETGKREPDNDSLRKIADYFKVTTDYLLGHSNNPSPSNTKKNAQDDINLDELEFALFGEVRDLNEEEKEELLRMARRMRELNELKKQQKKNNEG